VMARIVPITVAAAALAGATGCPRKEPNRLDTLPKVRMAIKGQEFELWVAHSLAEQNKGLMHVKQQQLEPLADGTMRGMLFVFDFSTRQSFWMKNTVIPLDIAYISRDGTIVGVFTMAPLDEAHDKYSPDELYRYAIEANAGVFAKLGLKPGDRLDIPESILKGES